MTLGNGERSHEWEGVGVGSLNSANVNSAQFSRLDKNGLCVKLRFHVALSLFFLSFVFSFFSFLRSFFLFFSLVNLAIGAGFSFGFGSSRLSLSAVLLCTEYAATGPPGALHRRRMLQPRGLPAGEGSPGTEAHRAGAKLGWRACKTRAVQTQTAATKGRKYRAKKRRNAD